ncbi:MFS transporter [Bradyrhizobium sp.]|uniref:MFS transporter n=1 Tax=Bradyrhizobium sp. TaxID=376 RepID=UPI002613C0C4|nr:MFS transporter [Bradyrhizobium sp.]
MITETVSVAVLPSRSVWWQVLFWTALMTVSWGWLVYRMPELVESGFPTIAARLMSFGLIALGLWLGLEAANLTPGQRRATWLAVMVPVTLWAAVAWTAAINGVFRTDFLPLPMLPAAIFLPLIVGLPLLLLSKRVGQVLDAMPESWLVALQVYRILGVQWLAYWMRGLLPTIFALPAGTGDVLTGLFALQAAIAVAAGTAQGRRAAIYWNIFGLADFAVAITLGMIMSSSQPQLIVPYVPGVGVDAYPNVLTPAFVVPSSILLHVLSIRQLLRRGRAEAAPW